MPLAKSIINDPFILLDQHRARGVDDVSTYIGAIDGGQDQLFLNMGTTIDIFVIFRRFGRWIFWYDTGSTAGGIKQYTIISFSDLPLIK